MGRYKIALSDRAKTHLMEWEKAGKPSTLRKIERIIKELSDTPFTGIGSPEHLKFNFIECWSRKIDKKNRIIYQIKEDIITVFVISIKGHYLDK